MYVHWMMGVSLTADFCTYKGHQSTRSHAVLSLAPVPFLPGTKEPGSQSRFRALVLQVWSLDQASASPENLLDIQIPMPHPHLPKPRRWSPSTCGLVSLPGDSDARRRWGTTVPEATFSAPSPHHRPDHRHTYPQALDILSLLPPKPPKFPPSFQLPLTHTLGFTFLSWLFTYWL